MPKSDTKKFWWAWSSILKVPNIASLQCLYNFSKKKLWMEFIMKLIKIKASTSWIINFSWKPDMSKVSKKGSLLSFCKIFRKSIATVFLFYCEAKTFRYFTGFQSCLLLLVLKAFQLSQFCQSGVGFWYAVPVSWIQSIFPSFYISQQCKTIYL